MSDMPGLEPAVVTAIEDLPPVTPGSCVRRADACRGPAVRPGIGAARLLPPHIRPPRLRPIIRGSPLGSGERQQLGRSRCADQLCIRPGQVETRPGQVVRQIQSPTGSRPPAGAARRPALAARLPCPSGSGPPGTARPARAPLSKWALSRPTVVGVTGFEPATSLSEARSASVEVED